MKQMTPEEWQEIMRLYWLAKCSQNTDLELPIVYIAPKPERNGNGRKS